MAPPLSQITSLTLPTDKYILTPMRGIKELFIIGLFLLAIGVGTLVFGLTVTHPVLTIFGVPIKEQGDPVLVATGAGVLVLGAGILIFSIVWKRK